MSTATPEQINEVLQTLTALKEDEALPKNVRIKIGTIITDLKNPEDYSTTVSKSLHSLDEISEDLNLQPLIRTKI